jgi:phosphoglycerate dehydrogenase-like enzyme
MIAVHYQIDFSEHYLADYMAARGIGFLGWNTRFRGFESSFILDHALVDIGVGVRWLREVQGVETVVLHGNSGGGSLMAAYQAQAVHPHVTPLEGMRPAAGLADLPAADGYVASAAHPGRPDVLTAWMDASVVDENDPISTDSDLDLFDPKNGPPYSEDFISRYRSAQVTRNNAITDWAERELKRVRAAGFSDRPVHRHAHLGRSANGRPHTGTQQASSKSVLRRRPGQGQPIGARHRRSMHTAQLARHVEPATSTDACRAAPGPHRLPRTGHQRRTGHRRLPVRRPAYLRCSGEQGQVTVRDRHRPLLHHAGSAQREGRYDRPVDRETVALRVLAHFVPGGKVLDFLAPETDWLDIRYCAEDDDATLYRELPEAEVIWHVLRPLSDSDLERAPQCRLVHKLGAGVNTIDVEAATRLGIAVANMPGANAASVAEGAVLLMLAALRRLPELDRATRAGTGWPSDPSLGETVRDIGSCTVGLIGYGNIAKRVETIVTAMGADVLHTSTGDDGHPGWRTLPDLLAASDIVSLHLSLAADTSNLLDAAALALMKPSAVIVNTSRGPIIDEDALVDALRGGRLAAAGLDVFAVEPIPADNPLLSLDNVVLTPHVTWYTVDTMRRYLAEAVDNCRRIRDGQALANVVNGVNAPVRRG